MNKYLVCVILIFLIIEEGLPQQRLPSPESLAQKADSSAIAGKRMVKSAIVSGLVPGGAQLLQKRFFMAGTFLAFEAVSGSVAIHYYRKNHEWLDFAYNQRVNALTDSGRDSAFSFEESFLARHSARLSRYRMQNAIALTLGGYLFNVLDAIDGSIVDEPKSRNPAVAGWLAAIPGMGLGQIYNGKLSKAGLFIMGQLTLGVMAFNNHRLMSRAEDENARLLQVREKSDIGLDAYNKYNIEWDFQRNSAFRKRNTYLWYSLILYFVTIFDAVVDAHLSDYGQKMRVYPDLSWQDKGAQLNLNVNF
jgi:hypothetical protein